MTSIQACGVARAPLPRTQYQEDQSYCTSIIVSTLGRLGQSEPLDLLRHIFLLDAHAAGALSSILLLESKVFLFFGIAARPVVFFFEDRIGLDGLELSLKVVDGVAMGAAVGTTAGVGEIVAVVFGFFAITAPWYGYQSPFHEELQN